MNRYFLSAVLVVGASAACWAGQTATSGSAEGVCTVSTPVTSLRELREASGVALSRKTPGLLWSHNDSGEPQLFAIDAASGAMRGRMRVTGAEVVDWEDISAGPCRGGSCLYIADIGDNNRARRTVTVYRVPEPSADAGATEPAEVFEAEYPDGPQDAEALFLTGNADLFLVTKTGADATALYRFPRPLQTGKVMRLQRVARVRVPRVTDGDASPDGVWTALRTNDQLLLYRTEQLVAGRTLEPLPYALEHLGEEQGEGVAVTNDGRVYLTGEGGQGTFAILECTLR